MRWVIAAGIAGAVLEGILWLGVFMVIAGVELNGPAIFAAGALFGVIFMCVAVAIGLTRILRR